MLVCCTFHRGYEVHEFLCGNSLLVVILLVVSSGIKLSHVIVDLEFIDLEFVLLHALGILCHGEGIDHGLDVTAEESL